MSPGLDAEMQGLFQNGAPFLSVPPQMGLKESQDRIKHQSLQMQFYSNKNNLFSLGKLTGRFKFREEGSYFLAFHNVSDDMACYFGVGAICNNH